MYRLAQKLDAGIWYNPVFYNHFLIANKKNKAVQVYNLDVLSPRIELETKDISYMRHLENVLFCDNQKDCFVYDMDDFNRKPNLIVGLTALPAYVDDQYIYSNCKTNSGMKICKYDYRNLEKVAFFNYQLSSDVKCIDSKMVFSEKAFFSRKIFCIDKNTGQENWMLDVSDIGQTVSNGKETKGKIVGSLMVKNEELLVAISNSKLVKIDTNTGNLLWERGSPNHLLQLYGDRIINVDAGYYREISPDTGGTIVEYEMRSEYERHGFRFMGTNRNFTITESHVFIVDAMGYKMGCINRSTGKIDWSVEVGEGKVTLPHAPIIYGDKLYVLDDEGTLHTYDRE